MNSVWWGKEKEHHYLTFLSSDTSDSYVNIMTCSYQDVMVSRLLERANFDDKEESINKRCATFQNECRPVLERYNDKLVKVRTEPLKLASVESVLIKHFQVDADQSVEKVAEAIEAEF